MHQVICALYIERETVLLQVYADLAAKDAIALDSAPHKVRDFSMAALPGGYRRLLHRPRDLNWRLLRYSDPNAPLALSTLDRLTGVAPPEVHAITPGHNSNSKGFLRCSRFYFKVQVTHPGRKNLKGVCTYGALSCLGLFPSPLHRHPVSPTMRKVMPCLILSFYITLYCMGMRAS